MSRLQKHLRWLLNCEEAVRLQLQQWLLPPGESGSRTAKRWKQNSFNNRHHPHCCNSPWIVWKTRVSETHGIGCPWGLHLKDRTWQLGWFEAGLLRKELSWSCTSLTRPSFENPARGVAKGRVASKRIHNLKTWQLWQQDGLLQERAETKNAEGGSGNLWNPLCVPGDPSSSYFVIIIVAMVMMTTINATHPKVGILW